MLDLTYRKTGLFVRFIPNTSAGETAWREMAKQNGGVATVFSIHADSVIKQLRDAGYSVGVAPKAKPLTDADYALLDSLVA